MALPSSGQISLNQMHTELGSPSGSQVSINDSDVRGLINKGSGSQMAFSEWHGASAIREVNFVSYGSTYLFVGPIKDAPQFITFSNYDPPTRTLAPLPSLAQYTSMLSLPTNKGIYSLSVCSLTLKGSGKIELQPTFLSTVMYGTQTYSNYSLAASSLVGIRVQAGSNTNYSSINEYIPVSGMSLKHYTTNAAPYRNNYSLQSNSNYSAVSNWVNSRPQSGGQYGTGYVKITYTFNE